MKTLGIILLFALASLAFADSIPNAITVHGKLMNATNATIQGTSTMVFNIYTVLSGGTSIWQNTTSVTTNVDGIYSVILNTTNLSWNVPYFLGIKVGSDGEQQPRHIITSTPFTYRANITDHLNPNLTIDFSNITAFPSSAPTCSAGQFVQNASLSSAGVLTTVCLTPTASLGTLNTVQSIDTYITVANSTTSNFSANLTTFDARYRLNTGSLNWTNLTSFPSACSAGDAVTSVGLALGCSTFLTSFTESDPIAVPRITVVNASVVGLLSSNTSTNQRIDNINTSVVGLLSSNTSTNQRVDNLNTTKSGVGNSAVCTFGIANVTLISTGAPVLTCAAAQGGSEPLWTGNSTLVPYLANNSTITGIWNFTNGFVISGTGNATIPPVGNITLFAQTVQGNTRPAYMDDDGAQITLGRDNFIIAKNTGGPALITGDVVYVSGATGAVPNVAKAQANSMTTLPAIGVAMANISNNAFGNIMLMGIIENDTSAFSTGDKLYLSAVTAGAVTTVRPVYPNFSQRVGTILRSGVGNGNFEVTIAPFVSGFDTGTTATSFNVNGTLTAITLNGTLNTTNLTDKITAAQLANTAVSPSTYGGASTVGQFIVDAQGRLTSATNLTIAIPYANLTSIPNTFSNWSNVSLINTTTTNSTIQIFNPFGLQACNSTSRGSFQPLFGAAGKSDTLWWCAKNNSDAYGWILYANSSASGSG